tara:strand:+ start:2921 stop:3277 length:357 start_codon:yes stop_codon:yes gene_type:complete
MKKSQLRKIIKEEIQNIANEGLWFKKPVTRQDYWKHVKTAMSEQEFQEEVRMDDPDIIWDDRVSHWVYYITGQLFDYFDRAKNKDVANAYKEARELMGRRKKITVGEIFDIVVKYYVK